MNVESFNRRKYELKDHLVSTEDKVLDLGSPDNEVFKILISDKMPFYKQMTHLFHSIVVVMCGEGLLQGRENIVPDHGLFRILSQNMEFAIHVRVWEISMLQTINSLPKGYYIHFIPDSTRNYSNETSISIPVHIEGATSAIMRVAWESMLPMIVEKYGPTNQWFDVWPDNVQLLRHIRNAISHDWRFDISSKNPDYRTKEYGWKYGLIPLQFEDDGGNSIDLNKHLFNKFSLADIIAIIASVWKDLQVD
jgi:hypothetical protein